jgi:hypothetical protein
MVAQVYVDIPAILGVLTGIGLVVVLPTIALLLHHQRKMAELMHRQTSQQGASTDQFSRLEGEIVQLRQLLMESIIMLDGRPGLNRPAEPPPAPLPKGE